MPIPENVTPHCFKDPLDLVIENTAKKDGPLTQSDFNKVTVAAQIQDGIERYRMSAQQRTSEELIKEDHNSKRLSLHLVESYGPRPPRCHAHAIVSGRHKLAAPARLVMAKLKIGVDDTDNGCWLPENTVATPHPSFLKAPPHSRIHRSNYYWWINSRLAPTIPIMQQALFRKNLNIISRMLHTGEFPDYVMLRKDHGLPKGSTK